MLLLSACGNKENSTVSDVISEDTSSETSMDASAEETEAKEKRLIRIEENSANFDILWWAEDYEYDTDGYLNKITYWQNKEDIDKIEEYDRYGNVIFLTDYDYDEPTKVERTEEYKYDDAGNQILVKTINYENNSMRWEEWEYDDAGNMVKHLIYDGAGDIDEGESFTYDANGNVIEEIKYGYEGEISEWDRYEYNDKNLQVKEFFVNNDGSVNGWFEKEYDEAERLIKKSEYKEDGELYAWYEYIYDEYGNEIQTLFCHPSGSVDIQKDVIHKYDEVGNRIKTTDLRTEGVTEWEYDGAGNVVKEIEYNSDGDIRNWLEWAYDELGNQILSIERNDDGTFNAGYEWAYDQYGNKIKEIRYQGENDIAEWYEWAYLEDGTIVKEIKAYNNGLSTYGFEYLEHDNGKPIVECIYSDTEYYNDEFRYRKYEYDEKGREIRCSIFEGEVMEEYTETIYDEAGDIAQKINYYVREDITGVSQITDYFYEPINN